jgi:large conductance mechanosensitive channel
MGKEKGNQIVLFLKEYRVVSFAIALIIGQAIIDLVQSVINNGVMQLLDPLIVNGTWKTASVNFGPFVIGWGVILSKLLNLIVVVAVIYFIIKKVLKYKPTK